MTPRMRDALTEARKGPLRRVFDGTPGKPGWPANACTLAALVRHGLLERRERRDKRARKLEEWTITKAGRQALEPVEVVGVDRPRYLGGAARPNQYRTLPNGRQVVREHEDEHDSDADRGYTTDPHRAIDDLEVIDPSLVGQAWRWDAASRHAEAENPRERAQRLRNMRKAA